MIGVLSEAYQRTVADSESIWRGAQRPKIGADEQQKCDASLDGIGLKKSPTQPTH